jgi:hypothetical protein
MRSIKSRSGEGGSSSYGTYSTSFGERDIEDDDLYIIIPENSPCTVIRPLFSSIPWSNVQFTNSNTLTYTSINSTNKESFFISNPLPSSTTISEIKPVNEKFNKRSYCYYYYKNNRVRVRLIESGNSIGGFNDNELQLPCRFIVFLKIKIIFNGYDSGLYIIKGCFYLDVDVNKNVTLSK